MLIELEGDIEAANKARILPRLAAEDVSWDCIDTTDYVATALESASALADLIVVNRALDSLPLPDMRAVASSLVLKAGKPILAVPDQVRGFQAAGEALIGWDGSREAADALGAAVPLLALAGSVTLIEVGTDPIPLPAEQAAAYLSRHDIHPTILRMLLGAPATTLLAAGDGGRYDYLVMGAFGHGRFAEGLFGGVTKRLLGESSIPILIMH
jgi:nucleotide-binding universal stress UspA family protein